MLSKRTVLILFAFCCLLFAALFYTKDPLNIQVIDEQELFMPTLANRLADIDNILIDSPEDSIQIKNIDKQWAVVSKDGYPADVSAIRQLLYGVAELEILEVKTSNELLLGEIGLAKDDKDSARLRFNSKDDQSIADILFGKSQPSLSGEGSNWFVRQYKSPQSWLVSGNLNLYKSAYQWLDKNILSLEPGSIKLIELHPETEDAIRIIKAQQRDGYTIADLNEDEKIESNKLEQLIGSISDLQFDDVRPKSEEALNADIQAINIETTDGLIILLLVMDSQQGWIILQAIANSPDEDVNKKAESLNQLWVDWEYRLAKFKIEQLLNQKQDLLSTEESS